jgi:hypothetical protein
MTDAIDRGARTMEVAVRRAILERGMSGGPVKAGAIRVDAVGAALLSADFHITQSDTRTYYLDGRKD